MATFLKDKAHFFPWDIGNAESIGSYFDIKDLFCITLVILLPIGHCSRMAFTQCTLSITT